MEKASMLLLSLLLFGCSTTPDGGWNKPGASDQDFRQDRGSCVAQAFAVSNSSQQAVILAGCMQGKGWTWEAGR